MIVTITQLRPDANEYHIHDPAGRFTDEDVEEYKSAKH